MEKIELLRAENNNNGGLFYKLLLLPAAVVESYEPEKNQVVDSNNFSLAANPYYFLIEATPNSVGDTGEIISSPAGILHGCTLDFKIPGDGFNSLPFLRQLAEHKYFIVFARDLNKTQLPPAGLMAVDPNPPELVFYDYRYKVYGTKENPLKIEADFKGDPRGYSCRLSGSQKSFFPWWVPTMEPQTWLDEY